MIRHSFYIDIAKEYGIKEAVMFDNFLFWIMKNAADERNFHDGKYWTYNSRKSLEKLFPYLSNEQIKRTLANLEKADLLVSGNYNDSPYDKTKWYALGSAGEKIVKSSQFDWVKTPNLDWVIPPNRLGQNTQSTIITDKKHTDNKHIYLDEQTENGDGLYGELKNVRLSPEEYVKLMNRYPDDYEDRIDKLSYYIASKGDKYKSHYATINSWARKEADSLKTKKGRLDWIDELR